MAKDRGASVARVRVNRRHGAMKNVAPGRDLADLVRVQVVRG